MRCVEAMMLYSSGSFSWLALLKDMLVDEMNGRSTQSTKP